MWCTKPIERCSDGVEDQGAEESFIGYTKTENHHLSFGSRLSVRGEAALLTP